MISGLPALLQASDSHPHLMCSLTCSIVAQALKNMVERSWHKDPEKRPTFPEVVKILDEGMNKVMRTGVGSSQAAGHGCCSIQ